MRRDQRDTSFELFHQRFIFLERWRWRNSFNDFILIWFGQTVYSVVIHLSCDRILKWKRTKTEPKERRMAENDCQVPFESHASCGQRKSFFFRLYFVSRGASDACAIRLIVNMIRRDDGLWNGLVMRASSHSCVDTHRPHTSNNNNYIYVYSQKYFRECVPDDRGRSLAICFIYFRTN